MATFDDDWEGARQRKNRIRAIVLAAVVLGVLGFLLFRSGQQAAKHDARMSRFEGLLATGDLQNLMTAAAEAGQVLADEPAAPAEVAAVDSRGQLLVWLLYTGVETQRARARQSLELAIERDAANPTVLVTQALWEATSGSADRAIEILDAGGAGSTLPDWQAMARAEALTRKGDMAGAGAAVAGVKTPIGRIQAVRVAWRAGDLETVEAQARALGADVPDSEFARVMPELAAARRAADLAAVDQLGALLQADPPLTARRAAQVTVELSRLMRRAGQTDRADQLLERFLAEDEGSLVLQQEYARVQRFQGLFGAARTRADKALRGQPDDAGLLAELGQAAFFNDAGSMIRDRVRTAPEEGDGAIRAVALASLVEGNPFVALEGLSATRHVGVPGETELWLAEAYLVSEQPEKAREEAARAAELLATSTGAGSREVAMAKMYEGLAVAAAGDVDAGREILAAAFVKPNQTPWGAWVYGRFHEVAGDLPAAKDAYLLACHNGQDFSRSCFDLARLYDSLPASAVHRRTQEEAREHYLRSSPRGRHADEVRAALGR